MKNWSMNFISIMKNGMKGKMSSKTVDRIVKNGGKLKKEVRQYTIQLIDATPLAGGNLKIGDKMYFGTMSQKLDDYEKYESEVWKPVFEEKFLEIITDGGITKIVEMILLIKIQHILFGIFRLKIQNLLLKNKTTNLINYKV